jgi:hypothetical protein
LDFIKSIDGEIITNPLAPDLPKKAIYIRHDVDSNHRLARDFSFMEYENNIRSTYFLLHTADYFDYSDSLSLTLSCILSNNHEIGFHNDVLSEWWKDRNKNIIDIIEKPLEYLRQFAEVKATSCHGAREHYDRKYFNYQLWTQWNASSNEGFEVVWPQISLYSVELLYEAYFLPYTHYFSDSGNNWIGYVTKKPKPFERAALYSKDNFGSNVINEWNKEEKGLFQVLIHPEHWEEKE